MAAAEILKGNCKYLGTRVRVRIRVRVRWESMSPPTIVGIRKLECFCYLVVETA